jgi:cold shock CspA family protein
MANVTGKVKWFNSRAGYGFITVVSEEHKDEDIFVHHSSVKCSTEQYKYLIQGEYVNFVLTETNDSQHKYQADNVTGVCGGTLMCETRSQQPRSRGRVGEGGKRVYNRSNREVEE